MTHPQIRSAITRAGLTPDHFAGRSTDQVVTELLFRVGIAYVGIDEAGALKPFYTTATDATEAWEKDHPMPVEPERMPDEFGKPRPVEPNYDAEDLIDNPQAREELRLDYESRLSQWEADKRAFDARNNRLVEELERYNERISDWNADRAAYIESYNTDLGGLEKDLMIPWDAAGGSGSYAETGKQASPEQAQKALREINEEIALFTANNPNFAEKYQEAYTSNNQLRSVREQLERFDHDRIFQFQVAVNEWKVEAAELDRSVKALQAELENPAEGVAQEILTEKRASLNQMVIDLDKLTSKIENYSDYIAKQTSMFSSLQDQETELSQRISKLLTEAQVENFDQLVGKYQPLLVRRDDQLIFAVQNFEKVRNHITQYIDDLTVDNLPSEFRRYLREIKWPNARHGEYLRLLREDLPWKSQVEIVAQIKAFEGSEAVSAFYRQISGLIGDTSEVKIVSAALIKLRFYFNNTPLENLTIQIFNEDNGVNYRTVNYVDPQKFREAFDKAITRLQREADSFLSDRILPIVGFLAQNISAIDSRRFGMQWHIPPRNWEEWVAVTKNMIRKRFTDLNKQGVMLMDNLFVDESYVKFVVKHYGDPRGSTRYVASHFVEYVNMPMTDWGLEQVKNPDRDLVRVLGYRLDENGLGEIWQVEMTKAQFRTYSKNPSDVIQQLNPDDLAQYGVRRVSGAPTAIIDEIESIPLLRIVTQNEQLIRESVSAQVLTSSYMNDTPPKDFYISSLKDYSPESIIDAFDGSLDDTIPAPIRARHRIVNLAAIVAQWENAGVNVDHPDLLAVKSELDELLNAFPEQIRQYSGNLGDFDGTPVFKHFAAGRQTDDIKIIRSEIIADLRKFLSENRGVIDNLARNVFVDDGENGIKISTTAIREAIGNRSNKPMSLPVPFLQRMKNGTGSGGILFRDGNYMASVREYFESLGEKLSIIPRIVRACQLRIKVR